MKRRRSIEGRRIDELLDLIARMAGGDLSARAPISPRRDTIDALAFGLNLLGGELGYTLDGLRRSQAEAERASAAKEIFLRNVTHELRTPIASVLLLAEVLRRPGLTEQKRHHLCERIDQNAQTLLRMVDHLLDLTRVETQRLDLVMEALDTAAAVREAVELLELEAEGKGLPVRVVVSRGAYPVVFTDGIRLRQILLNVIGNAIKYTEAGRVDVRVGRGGEGEARLAVVDVRDTGVGVDPQDQPKLFEPFSRSPATARLFPGTGLGLALSRGLARALGGDLVLLRSAPGKGSTFRIILPAPPPSRTGGKGLGPTDPPC